MQNGKIYAQADVIALTLLDSLQPITSGLLHQLHVFTQKEKLFSIARKYNLSFFLIITIPIFYLVKKNQKVKRRRQNLNI